MITLAPLDTLGMKVDAGGTDVPYDISGMRVSTTSGGTLGLTLGALPVGPPLNHADVPTTAAAVLAAAATGEVHMVASIKLYNSSSVVRTISIFIDRNDAAPDFDADTLVESVTLQAGEQGEWLAGVGWRIRDSFGIPRMAQPSGAQEFLRRVTANLPAITSVDPAFSDVTGLSVPLSANKKYAFQAQIFHWGSAVTIGHRFAMNGPTTPTFFRVGSWSSAQPITLAMADIGVLTKFAVAAGTAYDSNLGAYINTPGATEANAFITSIYGLIEVGANAGNLVVRGAVEIAGSLLIGRGSWFWVGETDS